jgi:hypothetical protein
MPEGITTSLRTFIFIAQKTMSFNSPLGVCMHGAHLTLDSNHAPLLAYAREHVYGQTEAPAAAAPLRVNCHWTEGEWNEEANPFAGARPLNVIGKRMLGNADELIWLDTLRMKGLQLRFRREPDHWRFDAAYCFHPKKEKLESLPEYEYKKYFSLMSYLVYYPIMWYLESLRGWTVLHASALASARGGIMIGGLGGVGKTTTCVALMQRAGHALISENIIFTDGDFIYPCAEPIRLDEGSLAMLGANPSGLRRMKFPESLKDKDMFHVANARALEQVAPSALFLPQFTVQRYVRPLPPSLAAEKMIAMNRLTRELDDFAWYAAALEMHWPQAGRAAKRIEVLHQLTRRARCFELGIDRNAGVQAVVEDILQICS